MADPTIPELLAKLDDLPVEQAPYILGSLHDATRAVIEAAEAASVKPPMLDMIGTQRDFDLRAALAAWRTRAQEILNGK